MATVPVRYWRVPLGCLTPKASDRDVEVVSVGKRYKRDADKKLTNELEGYNLDFLAIKGFNQTVKLGLEAAATIEKIAELITNQQAIVRVKIIGYNSKPYVIYNDSRDGASIVASNIEITSIDTVDADDFDSVDFGN